MDPVFPQCSAGTPGRSPTVDPSLAAWESLRLLAAAVLCGAFIAGNLAVAWRLFRGRSFMEIPGGWLPVPGRWLRYLIFAVPMLLPLPVWVLNLGLGAALVVSAAALFDRSPHC